MTPAAPTVIRVSDIARRRNACPRRLDAQDRTADNAPEAANAQQIVGKIAHALLAGESPPQPQVGTAVRWDARTRTTIEAHAQAQACAERIRTGIDDHFPGAKLMAEVKLQHTLRRADSVPYATITGRADVVLTLPDGRRAIGEIKTSDSARATQTGLLQAAIYAAITHDLDRMAAVFVAHAPRGGTQCTVHSRHAENGGLQALAHRSYARDRGSRRNARTRFLPTVIRPSAFECSSCRCSDCAFFTPAASGTEAQ